MEPNPGNWRPLIEQEMAAQALAAVQAIALDLSEGVGSAPGPALSRGWAGLALFFAYLERSLGLAEAGETAGSLLEQAIAGLGEQATPAASLYHGFSGVAWVVEHLTGGEVSEEEEEEEEDLNEEIDAVLLSQLRHSPWRGEFDLLGGLVGWGVYALERLPRPSAREILSLLVARLVECAEPGTRGVVWRDPVKAVREPDVGMAHGAAGVIALLARILREGASSPEATSLLVAAVDGVLSRPARDGEEDDLAWCAGSAGLSVSLLAAGRACGRHDWEHEARRLAAAAAESHQGDARGFDLALCHGTAGLSHLFHRLYQATGDSVHLAAARRWLEHTLARRRPGEGIGGYLCRGRKADGSFGWIADPSFLSGAAGIGLTLLSAIAPVEPAWDRLLLLSGR